MKGDLLGIQDGTVQVKSSTEVKKYEIENEEHENKETLKNCSTYILKKKFQKRKNTDREEKEYLIK